MNIFSNGQASAGYQNFTYNMMSKLQYELYNCQMMVKSLREENTQLKSALEKALSQPVISQISPKQPLPFICKSESYTNQKNFSPMERLVEPEIESTAKSDHSGDSDSVFQSPILTLKIEDDDEEREEVAGRGKVKRRNGFKGDNKTVKKEDKNADGPRSKAKHLWITYGRKIIEYSLEHSTGSLKERVRNCDRLISKKGYSEAFLLRSHDSEFVKQEKRSFGRLALEFLETEVENSFLSSNYREDLLDQKEKVRIWISKLIR